MSHRRRSDIGSADELPTDTQGEMKCLAKINAAKTLALTKNWRSRERVAAKPSSPAAITTATGSQAANIRP